MRVYPCVIFLCILWAYFEYKFSICARTLNFLFEYNKDSSKQIDISIYGNID